MSSVEAEAEEVKEFFAKDEWPRTLVPVTPMWRLLYCKLTGGHNWKQFLWGGVNHPFDSDCCTKCWKFRGPLPIDRESDTFPCHII